MPRGTPNVDVTLKVETTTPDACVPVLKSIDYQFELATVRESLAEHGNCRVTFQGWQVDLVVPFSNVYEVPGANIRQARSLGFRLGEKLLQECERKFRLGSV